MADENNNKVVGFIGVTGRCCQERLFVVSAGDCCGRPVKLQRSTKSLENAGIKISMQTELCKRLLFTSLKNVRLTGKNKANAVGIFDSNLF